MEANQGWAGHSPLPGATLSFGLLLAVLPPRQQPRPYSAPPAVTACRVRRGSAFASRRFSPRPALAAQMGTLSFKPEAFRGLRLRASPCGACPLSYMRLTVAISRVFDRLGVWIGAPSGPSQPAAKRRI